MDASGNFQKEIIVRHYPLKYLPAILLSLGLAASASPLEAQDVNLLVDLSGRWKFEIGDDMRRADPGFDDRKWDQIKVPSAWEDQGYPGYDGYAWYRKHFTVQSDWTSRDLLLILGRIDDVDEVYVNGEFIGFNGLFPPAYITAYAADRQYPLPAALLKPGSDNVIAVRVYDQELSGGMIEGRVGLYERKNMLRPDIQLPAVWKFRTGDDLKWKEPSLDDTGWKPVRVPAFWEIQGFKDYDGFGWYRVRFMAPGSLPDNNLVLMLGKIDDFDEAYLNGERIGRTGKMPQRGTDALQSDDYTKLRAYWIPSGLLMPGRENVLAVRVYDMFLHGGIYDGPIGIATRDHYTRYARTIQPAKGWFQDLMESIFH